MSVRNILGSVLALAALTLTSPTIAGEKGPKRSGNIEAVLRDAHGRPTGVILNDGTVLVGAVKDKELLRAAVPGDPVQVTVDAAERLVLVNGRTLATATIGPLDRSGLKPLIANPIGIGGGPMATDAKAARIDDTSSLNRYAVTARVAMLLKSHAGAPSGLLLEDGTQVHVVPRLSGALAGIKPGMELRVEGLGTPTQRDATMWALSITKGDFVYLDVERGEGAWEIGVNGPFTK